MDFVTNLVTFFLDLVTFLSINVNDADWLKIQEQFAKERQWMTEQMQMHIPVVLLVLIHPTGIKTR